MRLGIGSWTYAWAIGVPGHLPARPLGALGLLERAAALGVGVVQVCDNLPLAGLPVVELEGFIGRARQLGIDLEVGTRGIAPEHLRTYLRLAERVGSPILRVVIDTPEHRPGEEEVIDALRAMAGELARARLCLAVENHDRFQARTLARIVERVASPWLGVCLDTVNSFGALEGPAQVVEVLGPYVVNLHVKDFAVRRASHNMGFTIEGRPAGQGQLDIPWLLAELRRQRRDPNAIVELWTPPQPTLEATVAREEAWAASSVEYLRQLIPD